MRTFSIIGKQSSEACADDPPSDWRVPLVASPSCSMSMAALCCRNTRAQPAIEACLGTSASHILHKPTTSRWCIVLRERRGLTGDGSRGGMLGRGRVHPSVGVKFEVNILYRTPPLLSHYHFCLKLATRPARSTCQSPALEARTTMSGTARCAPATSNLALTTS